MDFQRKVILVTGGARRVGAEISRTLAGAGAHVVIHYNSSAEEAESLEHELLGQDYSVELTSCDLTNLAQMEEMSAVLISKHGRIDALVGSAAVYYRTPFLEVTEEQWNQIQSTNLKSYFFLCQEIGRQMLDQKQGKIILITDVSAELAWPNFLPYTISKAGINHLVRGLAKALAPHVQVNGIALGTVLPSEQATPKDVEFYRNRALLKKIGTPENVARTVEFLLTQSDFMTGAIIPIDGGYRLAEG
ncbi:MAG: SDR family oxidoreductase [bacterium]